MQFLAQHHCLNHPAREAVAQCPQCMQFFCRECITEHDDRILCAACLRKSTKAGQPEKRAYQGVARAGLSLFGFLTAALFFYWLGQILLLIPTPFHDGSLWNSIGTWRQ